jgi:hypothetical protein
MTTNLTPEDFQKRFDAAAQAAQREYCDIFAFWRTCRRKACRRAKACGGDGLLCLQRGYAQVPEEASERALARVVAATAADADRPTKLARQMSPQSFYLWSLKAEHRPKQVYKLAGAASRSGRPDDKCHGATRRAPGDGLLLYNREALFGKQLVAVPDLQRPLSNRQ